jgi:hypothetical protein
MNRFVEGLPMFGCADIAVAPVRHPVRLSQAMRLFTLHAGASAVRLSVEDNQ